VWRRQIDGRVLTWRLAGINNQNFLARDEETGSFWQQISGKAVSGSMVGRQLELVHSYEVTFALWREENPAGKVLKPLPKYASDYEDKDWDVKMKRVRTVVDTRKTGREPRELMLGVTAGGSVKAYVLDRVLEEKLVQDRVGSEPVILVVGHDNKSIRVFASRLPGGAEAPDFYREAAAKADGPLMRDAGGSEWNFQGCAINGPAAGKCLTPVAALKDYWFDWHRYHPDTAVYDK
jgi:hypothetical protein